MYKKIITGLLGLNLLMSCNQSSNKEDIILGDEFYNNKDKYELLDVRTPSEYEQGHIENAKNIDVSASDFEAKIDKLDPNKRYVVYCKVGRRAAKAQEKMWRKNFKYVKNLEEGYQKYTDRIQNKSK